MKCDPAHTFVTSDHHFGLWKANRDSWHPPVFSQAEEEEAIAKWNSVVGPTDLVLYVGDFCDGDERDLREYRRRLNGNIVLVKGNHDKLSIQPCVVLSWTDISGMISVQPVTVGGVGRTTLEMHSTTVSTFAGTTNGSGVTR